MLPDLSFTLDIPVFSWSGIGLTVGFAAIMMLYWIIKSIVTIITGG
jgi:hypothetical protein